MWFFSLPSLLLKDEENPALNMAAVTVAAWHRSQWNGMVQSSPVHVMALLRSEVAFTLSSYPQGQSSYSCCLPITAAVLLSASYPQIHSHVYTRVTDTRTHGLSFLHFIFKYQSYRGHEADSLQVYMLGPPHDLHVWAILLGKLYLRFWLWAGIVSGKKATPLSLTGRCLGLFWSNVVGETGWYHKTQYWGKLRGQGNASLQFQLFYEERMTIFLYLDPSSGFKYEPWKNSRVVESKVWNSVFP